MSTLNQHINSKYINKAYFTVSNHTRYMYHRLPPPAHFFVNMDVCNKPAESTVVTDTYTLFLVQVETKSIRHQPGCSV